MLEELENTLKDLQEQQTSLVIEKAQLIKNSPEVKRFVRVGFETNKLEIEIAKLKEKIKEETMFSCEHAFINIDNDGNKYCIKCGLSTEPTKNTDECLKNKNIYEQTLDNSTVINTDYICRKEVVNKICSYIVEKYPYISDDELVHFVAVAIHNMQTKKKSEDIKKNRVKRLYIRPSFLEKSNML